MSIYIPAGVLALVLLGAYAICALKGKWGFVLLSPWLAIIGAVRVAKPGSYWARHYYGPTKLALAAERFPKPPAPTLPVDAENWVDAWQGVDPSDMDRITRRALKRALRRVE